MPPSVIVSTAMNASQCFLSCCQIAEAIKEDTALTLLDLGGNNIGPDGVSALASALKGHSALRTLELASNPIGDAGTRALADVLKYDLAVRPLAALCAVCSCC